MKKALILPLLAACCLTFSACLFQQQQQIGPTEQEWNESLKKNKQLVNDIQKAAHECTSMKWVGEVSVFNKATDSYVDHKYTYPVSDEDAATLRDMLTRLHAVKFQEVECIPIWGYPTMFCYLHFLDAEGKTIESVSDRWIGADSYTDKYGCQVNGHFSLPDADYAAWQKFLPADLQRRYDKAKARWKQENE